MKSDVGILSCTYSSQVIFETSMLTWARAETGAKTIEERTSAKQVFSKRGGFCPFSFPHHSSRNMKITASMGGYSCATHLYRTSSRAAKNRHRPRLQVAVRSCGGARLARKLLVLVQDTIWIQCGFADIAKVSNSCHSSARSRFCGSKAKRG